MRRTFSKSLRCASKGGREFIEFWPLFSLVRVCFLERLLLNVNRLVVDIPSIDFDGRSRLVLIADPIGRGHLSSFPGQQSEVIILPEHTQYFTVPLAFALTRPFDDLLTIRCTASARVDVGLWTVTAVVPS